MLLKSRSYISPWAKLLVILFLSMIGTMIWADGRLIGAENQTVLLSDLDIPLIQGFQEEQGSRLVFDTPQGRIIEVQAVGSRAVTEVWDYYQQVLPTLAWQVRLTGKNRPSDNTTGCDKPGTICIFAKRDKEILTVRIESQTDEQNKTVRTTIYFAVSPE